MSTESLNTPQRWIMHVDVDTFFVSCERAFNPRLQHRPVVVLSNNDGCCISLSREAKALGLTMGVPWFQIRDRARHWGLIALSSNYELYADMSQRLMQVLHRYAAWVEIYSIDEAFLGISGSLTDVQRLGTDIHQRLQQGLGLPVGVGIAPTKTLAKVATAQAKSDSRWHKVCCWDAMSFSDQGTLLRQMPVSATWGVASRLTKRLAGRGILTMDDLRQADPHQIRRWFSVTLMRTVLELQGTPCLGIDDDPQPKQQLIFSRMFAHSVSDPTLMRAVLARYAQEIAARLAHHRLHASVLTAYASTPHHGPAARASHPSLTVSLPFPTDDPVVLSTTAQRLAETLTPGAKYVRAGIVLTGLVPAQDQEPLDLFAQPHAQRTIAPLLQSINTHHGPGSIGLGAAGLRNTPTWMMRRDFLTPRATTRWQEIPQVAAT